MLLNAAILVGTVLGMEIVAYLTHKYLMHGPLWFMHRSHHVKHDHRLEWNDLFGLFFAIPSIILIYYGVRGYPALLWVGIGMTIYGAIYFGFHDVIVHRRLPVRAFPGKGYMRRIIQAHHIHHAVHERDGAVSFGFLYAPPLEKLQAGLKRARSQPSPVESTAPGAEDG